MATRFMYKALSTAALGFALSLLLATPSTASTAPVQTADGLQLDLPAAPSDCTSRTRFYRDRRGGKTGDFTTSVVSWTDNSINEDGFTVETWRHQAGVWGLWWSGSTAANATVVTLTHSGSDRPNFRFRVKAFNTAGDSAWSNWAH